MAWHQCALILLWWRNGLLYQILRPTICELAATVNNCLILSVTYRVRCRLYTQLCSLVSKRDLSLWIAKHQSHCHACYRPMCMGAPTQIRLNFVMRPYFSMFFSFHFLNFVQKYFLTDVTHGKKHIQMIYNYIFHCLWKFENHFPSGLLTQGSARP